MVEVAEPSAFVPMAIVSTPALSLFDAWYPIAMLS